MSSINFLPDDDKGRRKLEKKVRTIEYTRPEDAKKEKKSSHGGVLSMFKRSSDVFPKASEMPVVPLKPGDAKMNVEPIVKAHNAVQKVEQKTVIAYRHPETDKKPDTPKEKKEFFGWLKRIFSSSHKTKLSHSSSAMPLPPKPSYASGNMDNESVSIKKTTGAESFIEDEKLKDSRADVTKDFAPNSRSQVKSSLDMPPPPPPFNPFKVNSKPAEVKQEKQQLQPNIPPPPTPMGAVNVPPPAPEVQSDSQEPAMTEVLVESQPHERSMSFDVNLVPDELVQRKRTINRLTLLGVVVLVTYFGCVVVYGVLSYYKTNVSSNVVSVEETTARVQHEIDLLTPVQRDALVLQKRTQEIKKLLDSQIHWLKLLDALETHTMKKVTLLKVSASSDGQIIIQGNAPDAATGYEQIAVLQQATDFVQSLSIIVAPTIPQRQKTAETVVPSGLPFTLPTEAPPGETKAPQSSFSLKLQLVSDYLTSSSK